MSAVLAVSGVICLLISAFLMYKMVPRGDKAPPVQGDFGETGMALGQFILMVAGLALLAKAIF
jgi:hypothetical protein